ncbi:helix-turn-helix domain-containing protein [Roseovarius sp. PS-C2]|uniref:MerR family transcriptional regulator n=1 Tax=Roseovarius sp. PS-C2 TaxID=2820814 RepID=UPI001C0B7172|nr:helix-turn-helix domain-containing protein [Roseovarius sp. PS-C2]MBU3259983.1 helix-turn-helix domain-containing protein [Roseovarius sp. PS-C2]
MKRENLKIGDLSDLTGTKVVTIRYYEKIGLLPSPGRSANNYRSYDAAALDRLRFIRRCRDLGFSLDQIRELLGMASDVARPCREVDAITATHLAQVERKIADLQALAAELRHISAKCRGGGTIKNCRILDAMSSD